MHGVHHDQDVERREHLGSERLEVGPDSVAVRAQHAGLRRDLLGFGGGQADPRRKAIEDVISDLRRGVVWARATPSCPAGCLYVLGGSVSQAPRSQASVTMRHHVPSAERAASYSSRIPSSVPGASVPLVMAI